MAIATRTGTALAGVATVSGRTKAGLATINGIDIGAAYPVGNVLQWLEINAVGLANNDPISTVTDSSGNGNDATGSLTMRPLFKTNVQNGLGAALFDGVDDFLTSATLSLTVPFTVQIVFKLNANAARQILFDGLLQYDWIGVNATPEYEFFGGADFRVGGTGNTAWHVLTCIVNGLGTSIRIDGTVLTLSGGSPGSNDLVGTLLGKSHNDANHLGGYIGEVIVIDGAASTPDIETNEDALGAKWGIVIA